MGGRRKRLKRLSAASSKQQPSPNVFFIERNLGRHAIAEALRNVGESVRVHDDHLNQDVADEEWIELVGRNGWLAITKDRNIRYRSWELEAIKKHKAKVFVVRAKDLTAQGIAEILLKARARIKRHAKKTTPPFIAAIYRDGSVKAYPLT